MNKTKKIAIAAVAVVMAGAMAIPLAACGGKRTLKQSAQAKLEVNTDAQGNLAYDADTEITCNIGDKNTRSISYVSAASILSGTVTLPDGVGYKNGDLKPMWVNLQKKLNVKFTDVYKADSKKLVQMATDTASAEWNIVTDSADEMTTKGTANPELLLDFNNYLDYMPNYKAYLDANPVVRLALTSDTETGAMYYAPYFDGDNDMEKYVLVKRNWVRTLLDEPVQTTTTTFKSQAEAKAPTAARTNGDVQTIDGTASAVKAFMGSTDWSIIGGDGETTISVKYSDALAAAKSATAALGQAVTAAAGTAYTGTSGNIVDIMNFIIDTKQGDVTGDKLLTVLREYIDVAYKIGSNKAYTTRSDVFNGLNAAWDADLMTALFRCVVTNGKVLDSGKGKIGDTGATSESNLYALAGREDTTQRVIDLVALAGELFGARGLESRFEYTYIDHNGTLHDARSNTATYDALAKMSGLAKEGLLYFGPSGKKQTSYYTAGTIEALMMHDYSQTQTSVGGFAVQKDSENNALIPNDGVESSFDFAPILTPVSKWDTNDDGTAETIMRFTESWRSIKNTGFCVPYDSVKNDSKKLAAILKFVDYMFSPDGLIDFTYGPKADDETGANGFWYNPEESAVPTDWGTKGEDWGTFTYGGKTYASKTYYKGNWIPTVTTQMMNLFYGKEVNGFRIPKDGDEAKWSIGYAKAMAGLAGNYTDTARHIIGSTLPIGLKNQGFEYQCTAACGLDGTAIVSAALENGAIKHVSTSMDNGNWYIEAPTALPLSASEAEWVGLNCTTLKSEIFVNSSKTVRNLAITIMFNGYNTQAKVGASGIAVPENAQAVVDAVNTTYNLATYETYMRNAWKNAMDMWDIIK